MELHDPTNTADIFPNPWTFWLSQQAVQRYRAFSTLRRWVNWCFTFLLSYITGKYYKQEAQLLLGDRTTRKHAKDSWNKRGNDNLGWSDLQMYFKVIKSWTNRKLVYDFPLVVYSNFAVSHTVFEKFDVKQPNDLEIYPRSLTVVSPKICCVAMYVKCSEESERMKRKSSFLTTPL